jgi:hypothetical protein
MPEEFLDLCATFRFVSVLNSLKTLINVAL